MNQETVSIIGVGVALGLLTFWLHTGLRNDLGGLRNDLGELRGDVVEVQKGLARLEGAWNEYRRQKGG